MRDSEGVVCPLPRSRRPSRICTLFVLDWTQGMTRINIEEAKTHLSRYIDRVVQGDVIIVCRHDQPVAELRAVQTSALRPARVAGLLKGQVHWEPDTFAPMTDEELAEFDRAPVSPQTRQA